MIEQTLQLKFKNVPTGASLACSSTTLPLNRDERTSVVGKVLDCNNPEVNLHWKRVSGLKVIVPVLSSNGSPLMPCGLVKARHLIRGGKAKVVKLNPLVIQLAFDCDDQIQDVSLGAETFMAIVGAKFKRVLGFEIAFGYETKTKRDALGLEKSHINDAFVIAGGTVQERCKPYRVEQKRINNRTLQLNRKGVTPFIRRQRHPIQNRDFVWINGKKYLCGGTSCRGDTHSS